MQRARRRVAGVLRLGVAALALTSGLWPHAARAQAVSGTILGTVRDATGGAVPAPASPWSTSGPASRGR